MILVFYFIFYEKFSIFVEIFIVFGVDVFVVGFGFGFLFRGVLGLFLLWEGLYVVFRFVLGFVWDLVFVFGFY